MYCIASVKLRLSSVRCGRVMVKCSKKGEVMAEFGMVKCCLAEDR